MNISSQPPSVEPGGACIITVFAMGEYMVPLEGVDITLVSRIKGVTLSPDSGKTDPDGRFESIMFANTVENPLITIAGAATTSRDISNIEGVVVDIPLQIPAWENQKPVAVLSAAPVRGGNAPLQVAFSAEQSYDPDGMIITYDWDFGDGERGSGKRNVHTYSHPGSYTATLMVMDHRGGHSDPAFLRVEVQERTVLQSLSGNPVLLSALLAGIVLVFLGIIILAIKRE